MTFKFFKMTIVSLFILSTYASANDQLTIVTFQFKKKEDRDLAARFSHLDILSQNTGKAIVNSYDLKMMKEKNPHLILETKRITGESSDYPVQYTKRLYEYASYWRASVMNE